MQLIMFDFSSSSLIILVHFCRFALMAITKMGIFIPVVSADNNFHFKKFCFTPS